jgi:hypothetical protein
MPLSVAIRVAATLKAVAEAMVNIELRTINRPYFIINCLK